MKGFYLHVTAENDGELLVNPPLRFLIFNIKQTLTIGGKPYTIWFPPDYGSEQYLWKSAPVIHQGEIFHRGEDVIKLQVNAGDHLFVDRVTYNFRPPERGEIIVFETKGIPEERREAI